MLPLLGEKAKNSKQGILERTLGRRDGAVQRKFSAENFRGESENTLWSYMLYFEKVGIIKII